MSDKDVSRLVVEKTLAKVERLRVAMAARIPYGPRKVALTAKEAKRLFASSPSVVGGPKAAVGLDEWESLMERLYAS